MPRAPGVVSAAVPWELASRPEVVAAALADPAVFADAFCYGVDYEARPPETFKTQMWGVQRRYMRHLARLEPFALGTPYHRPGESGEPLPTRVIVDKTRGVGMSWTNTWFIAHAAWAFAPCQVLLVSDVEAKAVDLLSRFDFTVKRLPPALGMIYRRGGDAAQLKRFANGSEVHSLSGNPGRIRSFHPYMTFVDEAAYLERDPMAALLGLKGIVAMVSTANGYGNAFADVLVDAMDNDGRQFGFVGLFMPWTTRPDLKQRPVKDARIRAQEYPETWQESLLASGRPFFDLLSVRALEQVACRPPLREVLDDHGKMLIWADPVPGRVYVTSGDVARGIEQKPETDPEREVGGADYSYAVVRDWDTGEQVASWHGREAPWAFAARLRLLWKLYLGVVVPERNTMGEVVAYRLHQIEPECIYFAPDGKPGWLSTETTRKQALDDMHLSIERGDLLCRELAVYNEIRVFEFDARGKPQAKSRYHDDRVLAWAVSEWVRLHSNKPRVAGAAKARRPLRASWDQ